MMGSFVAGVVVDEAAEVGSELGVEGAVRVDGDSGASLVQQVEFALIDVVAIFMGLLRVDPLQVGIALAAHLHYKFISIKSPTPPQPSPYTFGNNKIIPPAPLPSLPLSPRFQQFQFLPIRFTSPTLQLLLPLEACSPQKGEEMFPACPTRAGECFATVEEW